MGPKARAVKFYSTVSDRSEVVHLISRLFSDDGGPGSGNHHHAGRPGKVGGSAPGKGSGKSGPVDATRMPGEISTENKLFNGISVQIGRSIAKKAEKHPKVYDDWASSLTADEARAIEDQFRETHKPDERGNYDGESMSEYYERVWRMLAANAKEVEHENKPVEGKDITESYDWKEDSYTEPKFGQVIDTQIEDILVKQGFNGVPKVVSKEEMDKFLEENPDAPIMMRTFSAPDKETLDQYDRDLEKGAWYVDCGIGGSKYGQGMYTAAALPWNPEDVDDIDDPDFANHASRGQIIADKKTGRFYQLNESFMCTEGRLMDLNPGDVFLANEYQNGISFIFRKEPDGKFTELEMGDKWDMSDLEGYDEIYTLNPMSPERMAKRDVDVPLEQMRGYIRQNESRVGNFAVSGNAYQAGSPRKRGEPIKDVVVITKGKSVRFRPDVNEKKELDGSWGELNDGYYILDCDEDFGVRDTSNQEVIEVKDGQVFPVGDRPKDYYQGRYFELFRSVRFNHKVYPAKIVETSDKPVTSTRRMSLDPSAKMIPYEKLTKMFEEYKDINSPGRREARVVDDISKEEGFTREQREALMGIVIINGQESYERARARTQWKRASEKLGGAENVERLLGKFSDKYARRTRPYIKDEGAYAAALGYDAVVCSNYGRTIVVLNRTKLILSDERVEVPIEEAS